MKNNLTKIQQRAVQYWFVDGLSELGIGTTMIMLAALFWFLPVLIKTTIGEIAFYLIAFAGAFGIRRIIQRIKETDTYPRTGYVANKDGWENKRAIAAILGFTALLLAAQIYLAFQRSQSVAWMPFLGGLILAFIFALIAFQAGLSRFYIFALFALVAGSGLMLSGLGDFHAAALLTALTGLILLVSGARIRWFYTHQNPPLHE